MALPAMVLNLKGGVRIVVPADPMALSSYVFLESEDWFEDEAEFVRALSAPGFRMLDIGANLGFYTLAAAAAAKGDASIVAFEPTPECVQMLAQSVALNGYHDVQILPIALGRETDDLALVRGLDSALNRIGGPTAGPTVPVRRLDDIPLGDARRDFDFVKIDVEGSEQAVLEGGARFFDRHSPLVMFEVVEGGNFNADAATRLLDIGYQLYELTIEPPTLVPYSGEPDSARLNLFAAKQDRAGMLEARGLLARTPQIPASPLRADVEAMAVRASALKPHRAHFLKSVGKLADDDPLFRALGYLNLCRIDVEPNLRAGALAQAHIAAAAAFAAKPNVARRVVAARTARLAGRRQRAAELLGGLADSVLRGEDIVLDEPFVPLLESYVAWESPGGLGAWFSAMIVEAQWRWAWFSDRFQSPGMFREHPADTLRRFGREGPELERRRQLSAMRSGRQKGPIGHPFVCTPAPDNLNPLFWSGSPEVVRPSQQHP